MVSVDFRMVFFQRLTLVSSLMSETAEKVATSLKIQLETSKKVVEMTCQMTTMTNLAREANRTYEMMNDVLLTVSSLSSTAIEVGEITAGIRSLEIAAQSMYKTLILTQFSD